MPERHMNQEDWERYYTANRAPWIPHDPLLEEEAARLTPGRALELACGEGSDALHLAGQGFEVLATDFAPAALAITMERAEAMGLAVRTMEVDAAALRLSETFHFIYMGYLSLPAVERARALTQLVHHLVPNGVFLYIGLEEAGALEEIAGHLSPLCIERAETLHRVISMPNAEHFEADCVIVRARREVN